MTKQFGIWSVNTELGITCEDPSYQIPPQSLWDPRVEGDKIYSDWYLHMAQKNWVTMRDLEDLFNAFDFALDYFSVQFKPDDTMILWEESKKNARNIVAGNGK